MIPSFSGTIMQQICGLFLAWTQWTSLLTDYFSAMDNIMRWWRISMYFGLVWSLGCCVFSVCRVHLCSPSEAERLFVFIVFTVAAVFNQIKWAKTVFFVVAARGRVWSTHSHTFTHLGAVQFHQCHHVLLTDHLHQPLRSACLRERCLSEMRKEKIGPVQGEMELSSCSVCVHTDTHTVCLAWLLLTAPPSPLSRSRLSLPLQQ